MILTNDVKRADVSSKLIGLLKTEEVINYEKKREYNNKVFFRQTLN